MATFLEILHTYVDKYGYVTVAIVLLLENMGVPVPGETVLLLVSFLAYSEREFHFSHIVVVGTIACIVGDNLGYLIGYRGGRRLIHRYQKLFWIKSTTLAKGERLFQRHGSMTVLFARFIAGLRIVAGPLAGVLHMNWPKFLLFNSLGAVLWVSVISSLGYFFGEHWDQLLRFVHHFSVACLVMVCTAGALWLWRRLRHR